MVTGVEEETDLVDTENVALVAPAGTVTLCGTVAAFVLLLESDITAPPEGAAALSVTVPCEALPPVTLVGFSVRDESTGEDEGVGVSVAVGMDVAVEMGVGVDVVVVVTVVTWLAELLVSFGSNSCPETKASLRKLPMDCGMVATAVTLAVEPGAMDPRLQINVFTASGTPQLPWLGVMDPILKLLLSRTVRDTAVAVTGPAFATVSV